MKAQVKSKLNLEERTALQEVIPLGNAVPAVRRPVQRVQLSLPVLPDGSHRSS